MSTNGKRYISSGPISDGTVYSQAVNADYSSHVIGILFYSDENLANLVDKSTMTGTVTFTATNDAGINSGVDEEYGSVQDGVLTLGSSTYLRPVVSTQISRVKVVFAAVTGATHYKLIVGSTEG